MFVMSSICFAKRLISIEFILSKVFYVGLIGNFVLGLKQKYAEIFYSMGAVAGNHLDVKKNKNQSIHWIEESITRIP